MSPDVNITIKTIDESTQANGRVTGSLTELNSAIQIGRQAYEALNKVYEETIGKTLDYADSVRQLSLVSQTSAENSSILIQVFDDFKISASQLTPIVKALTAQGLSPNLETIAKLSDEYVALKDPVEQAAFLFKNFGRAGDQMAEAMSKGGDALLKMGGAIDKNQILSQKQLDLFRQQEIAVDNLSDKYQGLTIRLSTFAVPAMNNFIDALNRTIDLQQEGAESGDRLQQFFLGYDFILAHVAISQEMHNQQLREADTARLDGLASLYANTEGIQQEGAAAELTAEQLQTMNNNNNDLLSLTMSLQKETSGYNEKLQELTQKYGAASEQVQNFKQQHQEAMNQIAYDLFVAKLKADGFTDAEYQMALKAGVSLGLINQQTASTAENLNAIATAASTSKDGAEQFGDVVQKAMSDGVITSGELQIAMDRFSTQKIETEITTIRTQWGILRDELEVPINVTIHTTTTGSEIPDSYVGAGPT